MEEYNPYYYKNGKPWHEDRLTEEIAGAKKRIEDNKPFIALCDGNQGFGKSTFMVEIMDEYNRLHGLPPVSLDIKNHPQYCMGGNEFIAGLNACVKHKLPCIAYDEAGDFNKSGTLSGFNRIMARNFQYIRSARMFILMGLPNFNDLDNTLFRDGNIRFAIHIINKTKRRLEAAIYDREKLNWVRWYHNVKLPQPRQWMAYKIVAPLYHACVKPLPPDRQTKLDLITNTWKMEKRLINEASIENCVSKKDILNAVHMSQAWLDIKMAAMHAKPQMIIGRKNYYHKSIIDDLKKLTG